MDDNKKTILVVEDEPALREAIKLKLEKAGIEVWTAGNGLETLSILREKKPMLVWLDVLMPGMNGLELLQKIRQDENFKNLAVVIVSVSAGQEKIKQAFSLNVLDYIIKSEYTIDEIVNKVEEILDKVS